MIELLAIQWGIVLVFVFLHFILGFMRGTSKSTYYTIVSIIMTIITLGLVSFFTIRWFFTPESLIQLINTYAGSLVPAEFSVYLLDPNISGFLFAMVDLVLRIIGFLLFYPMIKTSLTFTIFRPIWKRLILPKLLAKQDEKRGLTIENNQPNKKLRKSKRLKKNVLSRFGGGMAGAVRGFIVAFVFLLPVIVIGGFVTTLDDSDQIAQSNDTQNLGFSQELNSLIPPEFQGYIDQIYDMHNNGLGGIVSAIKINNKSLDRAIFDEVFTTDIVVNDIKTEINFGQELESITSIVGILVAGGYLDSDFDYQTINRDNLDDVEQIFIYVSKSQLLGYMIPTAVRFGVKSVLVDQIGVDLYDSPYSADALASFESIDWEEEFMRLFGIAKNVLEFGSVAELLTYAENPGLLAELSPEEGVALANIIRSFSELRTLGLLNVAVEYGLSTEGVRSQFSWIDEADLDAYFEARFAFILENPEFFYGEDSDWIRIAEMVEIIFSDEYGDIDLQVLFTQASDPAVLLNPDNAEWVGALIEKFVEIQLIMETIPVGVDYGLYNVLGDQIERDLADRLAESFEAVNWDEEIIDVSNIYKDVLKLGLESAFGEDPNYYAIVDDIAVNQMDDLRALVAKIFEDSLIVNLAIEVAAPVLIETMITNDQLRDIAKEALFNNPESDEIDFNFGYEINQVLTIIEVLNEFSSTSKLMGIIGGTTIERLEFISALGTLPQERFDVFTGAFSNLQLLERVGGSGLQYMKDSSDIEMLYVPTEVDLANDISTIFRLMHYIGGYMNERELIYGLLEDIDFTEMLEDEAFRAFLLSTASNQHSQLLFFNIAHNVKQGLAGIGLEAYLTVPEELVNASVEDDIWETEINSFLDTVFNIMASVSKTGDITLSIRGMSEASQNSSTLIDSGLTAFLGLIGDNADPETGKDDFDRFLDSKIIYVSIAELLQGDFLSSIAGGALSGVLGPDAIIDLSAPVTVIGVDGIDEDIEVGRITKEEVKKIFSSIGVLGVTNPDDVSELGAQLITNMIDINNPNDDFSVFLESDYLYVIIARLFSMEALGTFLGDTLGNTLGGGFDSISMFPPIDAMGTTGVEEGLLTRVEVRQLFVSLKLLSPEGSLEGLGIDTILNLIDDTLLPGETDDFYLFLESKYMWDKISQVLLADGIVDLIANGRYETSAFVLPPSSTVIIDDEERLTQAEIHHLFSGLKQLGIGNLDTIDINIASIISLTDNEIDNILQSNYLYTVIDLTIKTVESITVPSGAFEDDGEFLGMIKKTEIKDVFKTLNILGINDLSNVSPETITIAQVNEVLLETDSLVVRYLISSAIVQALGEDSVPDEAFLDEDRLQGVLSDLELEALISALTTLSGGDETKPIISIDVINIRVGDIQTLKDNESFIIKQLVSNAIVAVLAVQNIRETAFNDPVLKDRLTNDEIGYMIDLLLILSGNDEDMLVTAITLNASLLSISTLKQFNENSIILNRLISKAIIDGLGETNMPDESFEDDTLRTDLIRAEIDALLDALEILGIGTSGAGAIGTNDLTFTELDEVVAVGTTDLVKYPLGFSPIVVHVLSKIMITAVSDIRADGHNYGIPTTAYRANGIDLLHSEIEGLIDALKLIGNVEEADEASTTIADITINANNFNGTLISNLVGLDKLIVYRLISRGINDSSMDTDESHVTDILARNYDPGLPGAPLVFDIKIAEMNHIATSMNILGITSIASIATDITLAGLKGLNNTQIEGLVEAGTNGPNTIIYYTISKIVDSGNNAFDILVFLNPATYPGPADDYYVMDGTTRVRLKRTSIALAIDAA